MSKSFFSAIALFVGAILFVATSPNKNPFVTESAEYPQTITLNPTNPTHAISVNTSGRPLVFLNFTVAGNHAGNTSGVLTLNTDEEIEDSGSNDTYTIIRGGFADQGVEFFNEFEHSTSNEDPFSEDFTLTWDGESEIAFTLTVNAYGDAPRSDDTGEYNFIVEVQ